MTDDDPPPPGAAAPGHGPGEPASQPRVLVAAGDRASGSDLANPAAPGVEPAARWCEPVASGPRTSSSRLTDETSPSPSDESGSRTHVPDAWDRFAAWAFQRGALPGLGVLTIGMIILYAGVFRGEPAGDDLTFHMAESARIADCLRVLDFDLWNPSANAGFASAYYYQVVPQLASAIPAAVFGHHLVFFQLSVVLPLVLAPALAYRGMRVLGATPWQAVIAALAIGLHNGQSRWGAGNAGTFSVGLYTQTWALAFLPLALAHAVRWATAARGLGPALAWGAFVTLCHPFAGVSLAVALVAGWFVRPVIAVIDLLLGELVVGLPPEPPRGTFAAAIAYLVHRWQQPPAPWLRPWLGELARLAILAVGLVVTWMPIWLPLIVDYEGFGGFPHRVNDEVGPGFATLVTWYSHGAILDHARPLVMTLALPVIAMFARAPYLRWLWAPALAYAIWLGLGPHLGKTDDDLVPAVRFLGAMQVVICLAVGAGAMLVLRPLWHAEPRSALARGTRFALIGVGLGCAGGIAVALARLPDSSPTLHVVRGLLGDALSVAALRWLLAGLVIATAVALVVPVHRAIQSGFGLRSGLAVLAAVLAATLIAPGARALEARVNVLSDFDGSRGDELHEVTRLLQREPPGRKQVGAGAENHWWNLLSYEYGRRPSLLMMGGGGLQASPNYDFLWTVKDFAKNAWVYDAPILVYEKKSADAMPAGDVILTTQHYQARRLVSGGLVSPVHVTGVLPPGRKAARAAALDWFRTDAPRKDEVLAYAGFGGPGAPPRGTTARAVRQDSPGDAPDIVAEVDASAPTTFVARESWHPRWRAFLDGVELPVRRVTPDFPAVDVPAGRHTLAFRFDRPWWALAAWLAVLLVPLLAWLGSRRWSLTR